MCDTIRNTYLFFSQLDHANLTVGETYPFEY